jgi:predicted dehydrogenase
VNILIVGLGSIAKKHVFAINKIRPHAKVYAVRSDKNAANVPGVHSIYSLDEVDFKPDFIIISNPTLFHEEYIKRCLRFRSPLFIEKPALLDLTNAGLIVEEVRKSNVITYIGCNMRFHPALKFLKKFLFTSEIRINEVNIYCGSYLPNWRPGRDFRTIYSSMAKLGGGVHLDLIHELDYCVWLFGEPEETWALKRSVSSLDIDSIDYSNFNLSYPGFSVAIQLNYYRIDPKRQIEILTSDDTIIADLITNRVYSSLSGKVFFEQTYDISETYFEQMQYFINNIDLSREMMNSFEEGVKTLKIALNGKTY